MLAGGGSGMGPDLMGEGNAVRLLAKFLGRIVGPRAHEEDWLWEDDRGEDERTSCVWAGSSCTSVASFIHLPLESPRRFSLL